MLANEQITKAAQTAELLMHDIRELHRSFCMEQPAVEQRIAEQHVLGLLNQEAQLHRELKGIES